MTTYFDVVQSSEHYQEGLQQWLEQARQQLTQYPLPLLQNVSSQEQIERLEKWMVELNTWYYQRFHQTFFPFYKNQMVQEISQCLELSQDQGTLEQNILFVYKYYAQMYNQLTQIISQMHHFQLHLQQIHLKIQSSSFKQSAKFFNQIQDLAQKLRELDQNLSHLSIWSQKVDVRLAFKQFPGHFSILPAIRAYDAKDRKSARFLQELQLHIQLQVDLVQKMKKMSSENVSLLLSVIQHAKEENKNGLPDKKLPLEMRHWYKQYFCIQQQMYLQNIESNLWAKNNRRMDRNAVERYEAWLTSLLTIIKELWLHPTCEAEVSLQEVVQYAMVPYHPDQDQKTLKRLTDTVQNFLHSIHPSKNPDSLVLIQGASPILHQVRNFTQRLQQQAVLGNGVSLLQPLQEMNYLLSTIEFTFDEICESRETSYSLTGQVDFFMKIFKQYQQTFEELREIVNRQLQPRQAERAFKSFSLKIERWSLTEWEFFPKECIQRMREQNLTHLLPPTPEAMNGELFLLQIGSSCECVIPHVEQEEKEV